MLDKTQLTKIAVAGFGAAMASVYAIPEAHATIIPISFSEGLPGPPAFLTYTMKASSAYGQVLGGLVFNKYGFRGGKSIALGTASSLAIKSFGQLIAAGSFSGTHDLAKSEAATGTDYVGFRNSGGQAGWFSVNWGGAHGAITFLNGAYNTDEGGSIIVGQMAVGVPEPSELGLFALGLLALGAAGVRMRREARKVAELN